MSKYSKKMEATKPNDADLEVLKNIVDDAIKGREQGIGFLSSGWPKIESKVAYSQQFGASGFGASTIKKRLEQEALAQNSESVPIVLREKIHPIRKPFGPPSSGARGFTRPRARASISMQSTSTAMAKPQSYPLERTTSSPLPRLSSSAVVPHLPSNTVDSSSSMHDVTTRPWRRHIKTWSEPAVGTQNVAELRDIFGKLLAKVEQKRQEVHGPPPTPFKPSRMLLEKRGLLDDKPAYHAPGHPYQGDMNCGSFLAEVSYLEDNENCALWLEDVPVDVTEHDLFEIIKTDAVYCLHPNPADAVHPLQAAKVVFMTPEGARDLKSQADKGLFGINGQRIKIRYNRNGYRRQNKKVSRVLYVEGSTWFMTEERWVAYFSNSCVCKIEHIGTITDNGRTKKMEFRFCRVDGQAMTCLQAISKDRSLPPNITACFGLDPCDPASRNTSQKFDPRKDNWRS